LKLKKEEKVRTILIHLSVEVPEDDERDSEQIISAIADSLAAASSENYSVKELEISIPLAEEI